ncbi:MAG: restriction endonuclease subunit S, partial [Roseburia sp.]|nr:restriction endonuclease subunit S [Roseburia sp.]
MLIKDICKIVNGATPSTSCPEYWDGNISWLTPKDLSGYTKRYISCGERSITQQGYNSCSTTLVPRDTILLTSRAPIGYLAMAGTEVCTNQGFKSIICDKHKVKPFYLFYWLQTHIDYLKSISNGATFKELSKDALENVKISLPDLSTQQHIVDTIGSVDD